MPLLVYHLALVAIAGAVGFVWGMGEIVNAFAFDTRHALRTGGAWLLLLTNALAAAGVYAFVATFIPNLDTPQAALLIGLAWPTVIRNASLKLTAGMADASSADGSQTAVIRLEQLYANFQGLARRLINAALAQQRARLIIQATQIELTELVSHARLLAIASLLQEGNMPNVIDEIVKR